MLKKNLQRNSLKPIITPLQELVQDKKTELPIKKDEERYEDLEMDNIQLRLNNKRSTEENK